MLSFEEIETLLYKESRAQRQARYQKEDSAREFVIICRWFLILTFLITFIAVSHDFIK